MLVGAVETMMLLDNPRYGVHLDGATGKWLKGVLKKFDPAVREVVVARFPQCTPPDRSLKGHTTSWLEMSLVKRQKKSCPFPGRSTVVHSSICACSSFLVGTIWGEAQTWSPNWRQLICSCPSSLVDLLGFGLSSLVGFGFSSFSFRSLWPRPDLGSQIEATDQQTVGFTKTGPVKKKRDTSTFQDLEVADPLVTDECSLNKIHLLGMKVSSFDHLLYHIKMTDWLIVGLTTSLKAVCWTRRNKVI